MRRQRINTFDITAHLYSTLLHFSLYKITGVCSKPFILRFWTFEPTTLKAPVKRAAAFGTTLLRYV
jgi:hypothetical protein